MSHKISKSQRYFGMTFGQLLILMVLGFIACLLIAILILIVRSNNSVPVQVVLPPTSKPIIAQPSRIIQPTHTLNPTFTPQPEILPGPAMQYVSLDTAGMPADYRSGNVEDYILEDGEYYKIKFVSVQSSGVVMERPQILFSSYVGNTIVDAQEKYIKTKLEFQSNSNWSYNWSDNTYKFLLIDEAIQYVGYHSFSQYAEVGRLLRIRNVSVLITISVQNKNGINDTDIQNLLQELDKWTMVVADKFSK